MAIYFQNENKRIYILKIYCHNATLFIPAVSDSGSGMAGGGPAAGRGAGGAADPSNADAEKGPLGLAK